MSRDKLAAHEVCPIVEHQLEVDPVRYSEEEVDVGPAIVCIVRG